MLRDIALRGANEIYQILDTDLAPFRQDAQNLKAQRMPHGLKGSRCNVEIFLVGQKKRLHLGCLITGVVDMFLRERHIV